jgi:hypothetical protein
MRTLALLVSLLACFSLSPATAEEGTPYLGEWSNGRGETLTITAKTIQFADNRAVAYRDVTRASDGSIYELELTARGEVNAFPGKTLAVEIDGDTMKMTGYRSHADLIAERNPQQIVTWERDSDD